MNYGVEVASSGMHTYQLSSESVQTSGSCYGGYTYRHGNLISRLLLLFFFSKIMKID
jgi:hypothetical protein